MQKINLKYPLTDCAKLFIEKGLELLYKDTLDTYRLRLHNPKTIIQELMLVSEKARNRTLNNHDYADSIAKEAKLILSGDFHNLKFNIINKDYFIRLLTNIKKENYRNIIQACKLLLQENQDYYDQLCTSCQNLINKNNGGLTSYDEKDKILGWIHYQCIELINKGYTKQYLHNYFRTIFIHIEDEKLLFEDRYKIWAGLGTQAPKKYRVIYEILGESFQFPVLQEIDKKYEQVNNLYRSTLPLKTSIDIKKFLEDKKQSNLVSIEVDSLDHFKAIEISRGKLSSDLDIYHLGFNNKVFKTSLKAAVISENMPEKASILPSNYQIDGFTRSSQLVFKEFLKKIETLKNINIDDASIDKIIAAIRYLRAGSESHELSTKFLNYWIGFEYIFTSFLDEEKTFNRMKKNFPICHALIYIKRNLFDFHKSIERIGISSKITNFNPDLEYLTKHSTYNEIISNCDNELMKYRSEQLQKLVSDPGNIEKINFRHIENLEWNLMRLYRIRNEIVHNAALTTTIYVNVSHIKYYLTFIINSILDFMSTSKNDTNNDGIISIEDYFVSQEIIFAAKKSKPLKEFISVHNPMQILH